MSRRPAFRRLLVTGGAGFIGSHLTLTIQERWPDARVTVVDDFRGGDWRNLIGFRGDVVAKDVRDYAPREKFDVVFHLASITDTRVLDQRLMVHENVEGFRAVLGLAPRVVYASSASVYGITAARMSESAAPRPANVYAFSKAILDNLARERGAVGVRYFNVYGPREASKGGYASMVHQLAEQALAEKAPRLFKYGEQKRDFVHVDDAVQATLLAAEYRGAGVFNVGSGQARSFNDVLAILSKELGRPVEAEFVDCPYDFYQPFTEADLTLSRRELGYAPRHDLESGIRAYLAARGVTPVPSPSPRRLRAARRGS